MVSTSLTSELFYDSRAFRHPFPYTAAMASLPDSRHHLHELIDQLSDQQLRQAEQALESIRQDRERRSEAHRNPESVNTPLVQENGLLVHLGKAPQGFDWDRLVEDQREERLREVSGL